jgi:hypothetical protein
MERTEYDATTGVMEVMLNGELYRFTGVPIGVYESFSHANDRQDYFEHEIRHRYPFQHVPQTTPADL